MSGDQPPASERLPAGESDWLRPAQAAEYLGIPPAAIRALTEQGRLPAFYTPGEHRRYRRRDLVRLKHELALEGGADPAESSE